jgi:hypothetical protein
LGLYASSLHLDFHRLRRVIAKNVDHLDDDAVLTGFRVGVERFQRQLVILARAERLPFVVEGVALVVPIDSPVARKSAHAVKRLCHRTTANMNLIPDPRYPDKLSVQ